MTEMRMALLSQMWHQKVSDFTRPAHEAELPALQFLFQYCHSTVSCLKLSFFHILSDVLSAAVDYHIHFETLSWLGMPRLKSL
jgi:hypothetical protein